MSHSHTVDLLNAVPRSGQPAPAALAELRQQMGAAFGRFPRNDDITAHYQIWGTVRCLVLTPPEVTGQVLYFHGGGFRIGSPELAAGFASHLAVRSRCQVVLPFYSLAPEHPFPSALLDGQAVLTALLKALRGKINRRTPLWLAGDSAGGNLAAVLARRFAPCVQGVLLMSPWLDLRLESGSFATNAAHDTIFSKTAAQLASELYLQGHPALDADVSPVLGNLEAMPPCCIAVGSNEVLLDDSLLFTDRLTEAHRRVALQVIPDMAHVEATTAPASRHVETVLLQFSRFMSDPLIPAISTGKREDADDIE